MGYCVVFEFVKELKGPAGDNVAVDIEHEANDLKHARTLHYCSRRYY
jgi:hypothetical protein